jgi:hypothetical protein
MRAPALGVHDALGYALAIELRHLLDEVVVVQDRRTVGADGERVLVAGDRRAARGGGWLAPWLVAHTSMLALVRARAQQRAAIR